jgi:hypothetical protein
MKDQYLLGESGATAQVVDLYLALKAQKFPLILGYFDGHKQVDIALPGKLFIEVYEPDHSTHLKVIHDLAEAVFTQAKKIPTIMISTAMLDNTVTFSRLVAELSKVCRELIKPSYEFSVACAPPFTAAQLQ